MAGFLTWLLEGDSLVQLDKFRREGDPRVLAEVGRNMILSQQAERLAMTSELRRLETERDFTEQQRLRDQQFQWECEARDAQREADRPVAMRLSAARELGIRSEEVGLDSEKDVNDFLRSL